MNNKPQAMSILTYAAIGVIAAKLIMGGINYFRDDPLQNTQQLENHVTSTQKIVNKPAETAPKENTNLTPPDDPQSSTPNDQEKLLSKYLYDNYGTPGYETSWYKDIKKITVGSDSATIRTDIYPDDEGKQLARKIAGVILYQDKVSLNSVLILDKDGFSLSTLIK